MFFTVGKYIDWKEAISPPMPNTLPELPEHFILYNTHQIRAIESLSLQSILYWHDVLRQTRARQGLRRAS